MVKVYRSHGGGLAFATGRVGSGPGEYQNIWAAKPARRSTIQNPVAWVFDPRLRRVTELDLSHAGQGMEARHRPIVTLRSEATPTSVVWENDSTVLAVGFYRAGRIGVFSKDGDQTQVLGPLPIDDAKIPAPVLQHAYQSTLSLKPDGTMLVLANRHAGRLELLRPTGERVAIVRGPFYFEPSFSVAEGLDSAQTPIFVGGKELRFGYVAAATTDEEIFTLFSGRMQGAYRGDANYGQFIHVFDWSGRFLRAYDLGQAVLTFDVDPSGRFLYAVRHDPEVAILVFDLATVTKGH